MEKPMKGGPNQMQWGSHLVKMTIFFDNVFKIPPSNQRGKFCIACRSQATLSKKMVILTRWKPHFASGSLRPSLISPFAPSKEP